MSDSTLHDNQADQGAPLHSSEHGTLDEGCRPSMQGQYQGQY